MVVLPADPSIRERHRLTGSVPFNALFRCPGRPPARIVATRPAHSSCRQTKPVLRRRCGCGAVTQTLSGERPAGLL